MSKGRDLLDRLPELPLEPLELAGSLRLSTRGPYVTIVPGQRPKPEPPPVTEAAPLHVAPSSSYATKKYWTQAIYPRVICQHPGDLLDDLVLDTGRSAQLAKPAHDASAAGDRLALVGREDHYKLTSLSGKRLRHPLWCTVKYGPWLAVAIETESCVLGGPNRWEFGIVEMPEVSMVWYGEWLDQPSLPNLTVIKGDLQLTHVSNACCPGYKWCHVTQSCIPNRVSCNDPVPV